MGFLVDLRAAFHMVHEDSAPECRNWEESIGNDPMTRHQNLERARRLAKEIPFGGAQGHTQSPDHMAVRAQDIDWSSFHVVVSIDISIPLSIRRAHPKVLWVYFPADPGTPTAKRARRIPPEGFDVSLTHTHRRFSIRPGLGNRSIECPYSFQSSFTWDQIWPASPQREGVMVEHQTFALLTDEQRRCLHKFGPVRYPHGCLSEVATMLRTSKYYLRLDGGPLTGNGQVEAIMAGCLALGNPSTYVQRSLFTPQTVAVDFDTALRKISFFESNPADWEAARKEQLVVAEFLCFRRPAYQLLGHLHQHRSSS